MSRADISKTYVTCDICGKRTQNRSINTRIITDTNAAWFVLCDKCLRDMNELVTGSKEAMKRVKDERQGE